MATKESAAGHFVPLLDVHGHHYTAVSRYLAGDPDGVTPSSHRRRARPLRSIGGKTPGREAARGADGVPEIPRLQDHPFTRVHNAVARTHTGTRKPSKFGTGSYSSISAPSFDPESHARRPSRAPTSTDGRRDPCSTSRSRSAWPAHARGHEGPAAHPGDPRDGDLLPLERPEDAGVGGRVGATARQREVQALHDSILGQFAGCRYGVPGPAVNLLQARHFDRVAPERRDGLDRRRSRRQRRHHSTPCCVAVFRIAPSSKNDSPPKGVLKTMSIFRLLIRSTTLGRPSLTL